MLHTFGWRRLSADGSMDGRKYLFISELTDGDFGRKNLFIFDTQSQTSSLLASCNLVVCFSRLVSFMKS